MDGISDTNDNKNRKINLIQKFIGGSDKTKCTDTDSSWIQFQGNNNNVNEKTVLRKMNSGRPSENGSNAGQDLASNVSLPQMVCEKEFYDSSLSVRTSLQRNAATIDDIQGINLIAGFNGSFVTDNNGVKPTPDDIDANEQSDNNSTDNLSFISDDGNNGLIDDIVLLPNNMISEDEVSNNSDDCVYAYRGADFDPIPVNAEDENDFLEMDFEPDPASEVELENNAPNNGAMNNGSSPFEHSPAAEFGSKSLENSGDFDLGLKLPLLLKAMDQSPPVNIWNKPTDDTANASVLTQQNGHHRDHSPGRSCVNKSNRLADDNLLEKTAGSSINKINGSSSRSPSTSQLYYDNTVTLSTKKYTGTIPKTSRLPNSMRTSRSKSSVIVSSTVKPPGGVPDFRCRVCSESDQYNVSTWGDRSSCHRCRSLQSFSHQNGQLHHGFDSAADVCLVPDQQRSSNGRRSMSFPVVSLHEDGYSDHQLSNGFQSTSYSPIGLYGSPDQSKCEERGLHMGESIPWQSEVDSVFEDSVSIYSICFSEDVILETLNKINIKPNREIMRKQLEIELLLNSMAEAAMNIPEYLVHMSKKNCNFKALISAIELSCPEENLDITFVPLDSHPKVVQIPILEILNRLPTNGSLKNILAIRNKQFHKMNVLGKIVNVIRKFSDMRHDMIKENYITIPQYYRSGYVYVSRKVKDPKADF